LPPAGIRFSVWAAHASAVSVVFPKSAYVDDAGNDIESSFPLAAQGNGIWSGQQPDYKPYSQRLYMFRITNQQGQVTYKTDLWSRNQIGRGTTNPHCGPYSGPIQDLDGTVSCSVVADPDAVTKDFNDSGWPKHELIPASEFWKDEFTHDRPLPQRLEDLIIYELHVGSLGFGTTDAGTFADALNILPQNQYGIKLLRELTRTVRFVKPTAFLIAEDHTGWDAMIQPADQGGIGFDAMWYADFYHHLIGDGNYGSNYAKRGQVPVPLLPGPEPVSALTTRRLP
jgi:1,4-alpha-glucan branching enzyme